MPVAPMYRSPYGGSIMELLSRQGDAQAQAAMMKGRIWGDVAQNVGQIGAQAYQQHAQQKDAQKREQMFTQALQTWDPANPGAFYRNVAVAYGPEMANSSVRAMTALEASKKGAGPDPKLFADKADWIARMYKENPDFVMKNWETIGGTVAPEAKALYNLDVSGPWREELGPMISAFGADQKAPGTRVIKRRLADGSEVEEIVEDKPGQSFASAAPPVKPENLSAEEAYIRARFGDKPTPEQLLQGRAQFAAAGRAPTAPAAGTDPGTVSAYVDDLAAGTKIWSDVPATIRNSVQVAARAAGVNAPTKRPTEKVLGELSDGANLVARTAELLSSPTGVMEWAKANGIPDWMTQLTGWGASAKANRSEFFMYMAETLKAIQGSRPSDKDMEWYMANLPRQGEAPQSAQLKIDKIKARLINQYNTRLTSLRRNGYALPGLELLSGEGQYLAPDENPTGGAPRGSGTSGNPYVFE